MSVLRTPTPPRLAARVPLHTLLCAILVALTLPAKAIVVRGIVTDGRGRPVPGARVQLIHGQATAGFSYANPDGTYEILSDLPGRFLLLTAAPAFAPDIGQDFYGGRNDVITRNITLDPVSITQVVTVTATGIPTPLQQVSSPVTLIPQDDLLTRVGVLDELRQSPGVFAVEQGQTGSLGSLFVRGGPSDANKILIDGIPAEDVGGTFDFGTVSSTALGSTRGAGSAIELYRGPNSALYGTDSLASVVALTTQRGSTLHPVLNYSGDAGNLHTWRDEAVLSGTHNRLDYLAAFSRLDTSNALALDRFHSATSAANLGYNLTSNTQARFTLRNADSGLGLPNAHDFYGLSQNGKQSDQDLYSGLTLENRLHGNWHNLLRYGIARKREQAAYFGNVGTLVQIPSSFGPYNAYVGNLVTIRGANGYTATGQAQFFSTNRNADSNRDELSYQSDYAFTHHLIGLFGFRYQDERGSFITPGAFGSNQQLQRTNFEYNAQFQGDIKNRLFYSLGGSVQKNHLFGIAGTPRLGLAWIPIAPSARRRFHGTRLRANVATGVQEPSLATESYSLYKQLSLAGDTTDLAAFHIAPLGAERSRTFDVGLDQNLLGEKLILKIGYFHNQFSHQIEFVAPGDLQTYFNINPSHDPSFFGAELNSLAFRAQGIETEIQYQPRHRLFLHGGYTWLDPLVTQSFSSDATAARQGIPTTNPNLPDIPIGGTSPLVGARPFRRPPHTGFFAVQYTGTKFSTALKGSLASRADDSTFLGFSDTTLSGNTLLLPNRNLDFGYARLDLNATYAVTHSLSLFTQLDNLLNQQHIGPIGYPGLPFTVRAGLKLRLTRD